MEYIFNIEYSVQGYKQVFLPKTEKQGKIRLLGHKNCELRKTTKIGQEKEIRFFGDYGISF